jgi:excisionase family DNA binding protein
VRYDQGMSKQEWLTLNQAAQQAGVHPSTLRRWADQGEVPVLITPGGHRRFQAQLFATWLQERQSCRLPALPAVWTEEAIRQTRRVLVAHPPVSWRENQSEGARNDARGLGRRLMGLAMRFVAVPEEDGMVMLPEAAEIGRSYAILGREAGLSLADILQASLFFHNQLLEIALNLSDNDRSPPDVSRHMLQRINQLLQTVHLAVVAAFCETDQPALPATPALPGTTPSP